MEFDLKKNHFTLNTSDILDSNTLIDFPVTNYKGTINATRTSITWNSISIKDILQDMYDDYELFNISLTYVGHTSGTTAYGVNLNDKLIHFGITGLDWVFTNYNCSTRNTTRESICSAYTFIQGTSAINIIENPNLTFRKCNTTDIKINFYTVMETLPAMNANTIYPQMFFNFVITPVI
jgi:hypothetical protein